MCLQDKYSVTDESSLVMQNWDMPSNLTAIQTYMDTFMARDSWKNTYYSPELVIKGWERHGIKKHE